MYPHGVPLAMTIVYISNYSVSCTPFPSLIAFVLSVRPKKLVSVYPAQNRALVRKSLSNVLEQNAKVNRKAQVFLVNEKRFFACVITSTVLRI